MLGPWEEHSYPGSGDKAGLRSGGSLYSEEEGIRANWPERGWESCSRLLPPVWAGPGWMAKLVVASAVASGQGQTLPQSTDAAVSERRGPVCGPDSEITPPPYLFPSLSAQLLLVVPPPFTPPTSPGQAPATAPPNNEDEGSGHSGFWIRTSFRPHEKNSMVTHLCQKHFRKENREQERSHVWMGLPEKQRPRVAPQPVTLALPGQDIPGQTH